MTCKKCRKIDNGESTNILLFWTGGAKSTYLLLQNLLCENSVTCTYVDIMNAGAVSTREKEARELLKEDIKIFCDYFKCKEPRYREDHYLRSQSDLGLCKAPESTILTMFALLTGAYYDDIQMGNSLCSFQNTQCWNDNLTGLYRSEFDEHFPDITRPLMEVSLEQIFLTLQSYDDLLGTNFVDHITSCRNEHNVCDSDVPCEGCDERNYVFRRLGWATAAD